MILKLPSGHEVLVDEDDYESIKGFKYYIHKKGYAYRFYTTEEGKRSATYLHHDIMGKHPNMVVDHINRNKLDNRKENLRVVSFSQNLQNSNKFRGNFTSQYKGVCWVEKDKYWLSTASKGDKQIKIGRFSTEIAAANAFNDYVMRNRDEHAFLNDAPYDPTWEEKRIPDRKNGTGKSTYVGVSWSKAMNKWQSHIMVNYKSIYLGCFDDETEAAKAYNAAVLKYRGEKARLNTF